MELKNDEQRRALSLQEAAAEVGVSISTLRRMVARRTVPFYRARHRLLFDRLAVREWIASGGSDGVRS